MQFQALYSCQLSRLLTSSNKLGIPNAEAILTLRGQNLKQITRFLVNPVSLLETAFRGSVFHPAFPDGFVTLMWSLRHTSPRILCHILTGHRMHSIGSPNSLSVSTRIFFLSLVLLKCFQLFGSIT